MTDAPLSPSRSLAAFLSLIAPGVGHLYAGWSRRGVVLFALAIAPVPVILVLAHLPAGRATLALILAAAVVPLLVVVVAVVDVILRTRKTRARPTSRGALPGGLLAVLAVVGLGWGIGGPLLVRALALEAFVIPTGSMAPTIGNGDRILVDKLPLTTPPAKGDIVVFRYAADPERRFIKRIVAIEGEAIDGIVVPEGHVYVLGDNRERSLDSRTFGPVALGLIVGRVVYRFWHDGAPALDVIAPDDAE